MSFPTRIGYEDARRIIGDVVARRRLPAETVALAKAQGRVSARDIDATLDQPGFDNSAMDGFALRHADLDAQGETLLRLAGERFAGAAAAQAVDTGECLRITTGAPMPDDADTVAIKENCRDEGTHVRVLHAPGRGQNVRRAGEDVRRGDRLFDAGRVLTPSRLALVAGQGMTHVDTVRKPTVAVFTTGDELVEPGLSLRHGQIYDSNRALLMGLLRADGYEPVAWPRLDDDPAAIASALRHAGHAFDVVITCGGVSAGEKDHLPELLQTEGRVLFWKVRMKPGMPVLLAESHSALDGQGGGGLGDALFLCLPGNPVSVMATYLSLGRALLDGLQGRAEPRPRLRARLRTGWRKNHARLEFLRGRLHCDEDGVLWVDPNPADGSHRMRAAADSNALIMLDEGERLMAAGDPVDVLEY